MVTTGPDDNMFTTGTVTICAYGSKATAGPVSLQEGDNNEDLFQPGATDEFKVTKLL